MRDKGEGPMLALDKHRCAWFSQPRSGTTRSIRSRTTPSVQGRGRSDPFTTRHQRGRRKVDVVEVPDSEDDFEVFNRPQSLEAPTGDFSHLPSA